MWKDKPFRINKMNHEDTELNPVGDEKIEARIIAWVLGQASAFESEELEKLCTQSPEWKVFYRRMLAIHGSLVTMAKESPSPQWRLSAERRGKLHDILGEPVAVTQIVITTKRKSRWQQFLKIAALVVLLLAIGALATTSLDRKKSATVVALSKTIMPEMAASGRRSELESAARFDRENSSQSEFARLRIPEPSNSISSPPAAPAVAKIEPPALTGDNTYADVSPPPASATGSTAVIAGALGFSGGKPEEQSSPERDMRYKFQTLKSDAQPEVAAVDKNGRAAGGGGGGLDDSITDAREGESVNGGEITNSPAAITSNSNLKISGDRGNVVPTESIPGIRSGDQPVKGEAIDGLLSSAPRDSETTSETDEKSPSRWDSDSDGKDAPVMGTLFAQKDNKAMESQKPQAASAIRGLEEGVVVPATAEPTAKIAEAADSWKGAAQSKEMEKLSLQDLEKAVQNQSDVVEEKRKERDNLLRRAPASIADNYRKSSDDSGITLGEAKKKLTNPDDAQAAQSTTSLASREVIRRQALTVDADRLIDEGRLAIEQRQYAKAKEKIISGMKLLPDVPVLKNRIDYAKELLLDVKKLEENISQPVLLDLMKEIQVSDEPYSTFSLRVNDASFKLAYAALSQGQRPAAESVRMEEFYNAFDYGDPMPIGKEPIACAIDQAAHPFAASRNLLRISMRTAAAGRSAGQPLHLTLLIDQSGSMNREDRVAVMEASIKELTTLLTADDQVSVIGFSRTPRLLGEKIAGNDVAQLRKLMIQAASDGGTNIEEALNLGEVLAMRNKANGAQNRILLVTDGAANLGNADPLRLSNRIKAMRQKGLAFDIAGIGTDGLNDEMLLELARNGNGRYYVINNVTDAKENFARQLAGAFRPAAENVKVQVQLNPQRVASYSLLGFEKDRLKTEDFRNDQVDAAELAAAEAGNAMYQVAILPEGTGDIGEVSVRFRDTATGEMVERKWTILYDANTPPFDLAQPSMQLAGLALFTAEKLRGGALGDAVRFADVSQSVTTVRNYYRQSERVSQLLEMTRILSN